MPRSRRLPAEVILDAIQQATASSDALAQVTTDLTGRGIGPEGTARYRRNGAGYADGVFGRSTRDTNCDCSRSDEPNLLQLIYLQNDPELLGDLDRKDGWIAEQQQATRGGNRNDASVSSLTRQIDDIESRMERGPPARRARRSGPGPNRACEICEAGSSRRASPRRRRALSTTKRSTPW